ncbi:hypothetical protein [Thermococcus sp.]
MERLREEEITIRTNPINDAIEQIPNTAHRYGQFLITTLSTRRASPT